MAMMKFREPNRVLWRGIRPGHNGTQFVAVGNATNATVILYTVPAGVTAHVTYLQLDVISGANAGFGTLQVWDAVPGWVTHAMMIHVHDDDRFSLVSSLSFPLELLTGWSMRVTSSIALLNSYGQIHGWIE